jgi:hypothetical protein
LTADTAVQIALLKQLRLAGELPRSFSMVVPGGTIMGMSHHRVKEDNIERPAAPHPL